MAAASALAVPSMWEPAGLALAAVCAAVVAAVLSRLDDLVELFAR